MPDLRKSRMIPVCGEEYTEVIPATGHQYGAWTVVKEATETEEGLKERVCSVCGEKESEVIPVLTTETPNNTNVAESDKDTENVNVNRDTSLKSPDTGFGMDTAIIVEFVLIAAVGTLLIAFTIKRKMKKTDK